MSHVTTGPGTELSDRVVALLRTAVPALWGTVVAWLLARVVAVLPVDLAAAVGDILASEAVVALVLTAAIAAWYALWRWLEPHVPAWLVRIVLGSARTPVYAPVGEDGVADITAPRGRATEVERRELTQLAAALEPDNPARLAIGRLLAK